jgi:hypothetical protein
MRRHDLSVPLNAGLFRPKQQQAPRVRYEGRFKAIHTAPAHKHVHDHCAPVAPMCNGFGAWGPVAKHPVDLFLTEKIEAEKRFMRATVQPRMSNKSVGLARLLLKSGATVTLKADGRKVYRGAKS